MSRPFWLMSILPRYPTVAMDDVLTWMGGFPTAGGISCGMQMAFSLNVGNILRACDSSEMVGTTKAAALFANPEKFRYAIWNGYLMTDLH